MILHIGAALMSISLGQIFRYRIALAAVITLLPTMVSAAPLSTGSTVGPTGIGPIVIGTTPSQAIATGTHFTSSKPAMGSTCYYLRPTGVSGLAFLAEQGTIRRIEVVNRDIRTVGGRRVGDKTSAVQAAYDGRELVAPDKYDPLTQTITIAPRDGSEAKYRLVFKAKSRAVKAIYAGALPQINYVEGCS